MKVVLILTGAVLLAVFLFLDNSDMQSCRKNHSEDVCTYALER